jgi:hypothetical protein
VSRRPRVAGGHTIARRICSVSVRRASVRRLKTNTFAAGRLILFFNDLASYSVPGAIVK